MLLQKPIIEFTDEQKPALYKTLRQFAHYIVPFAFMIGAFGWYQGHGIAWIILKLALVPILALAGLALLLLFPILSESGFVLKMFRNALLALWWISWTALFIYLPYPDADETVYAFFINFALVFALIPFFDWFILAKGTRLDRWIGWPENR